MLWEFLYERTVFNFLHSVFGCKKFIGYTFQFSEEKKSLMLQSDCTNKHCEWHGYTCKSFRMQPSGEIEYFKQILTSSTKFKLATLGFK